MRLSLNIIAIIILAFTSNAALAGDKIFGKKGRESSDIEIFPKWTKVLEKIEVELEAPSKKCDKGSKKFFCNISEWLAFIKSTKEKDKQEQLQLVNEYANKHEYILDNINWGKEDYWASPGEFLFKNGDCEDFAIIKYISLLKLGFEAEDLKIVILNDNNLGVIHAVLAVEKGWSTYILDNQISKVTSQKRIFHYTPIFSINEKGWWKYI